MRLFSIKFSTWACTEEWRMNQSLLWGVFCCGFDLLAGFAPVSWSPEHSCVCSSVGVPLERRLSWGHRGAGSGCAGRSILLTPRSRDCALMLPSRVWTHILVSIAGERCHSLKGKNTQPKNPSPKQKGLGGLWQIHKEPSERTGQGEAVRTSQQCGHRLGCQASSSWCANGKWCNQGSTGSPGMLLGLPLNTRSCWIVRWIYKNPPCQVAAETQSKICVFCFLLIASERSSLLSRGSVLI